MRQLTRVMLVAWGIFDTARVARPEKAVDPLGRVAWSFSRAQDFFSYAHMRSNFFKLRDCSVPDYQYYYFSFECFYQG